MTPTIPTILRDHVSLEVRCLDRLYLTGYLPRLQTSGALCYFLHEHSAIRSPRPRSFGRFMIAGSLPFRPSPPASGFP